MKTKPPLNNRTVTKLLKRYSHHKKDLALRNKIIEKALPLVDAAISCMGLYRNRDDLKQECALKIIYAINKYDSHRGDAFGFLWTVICNTCRTHAERFGRPSLSLSTDEAIQREAEASSKDLFLTPENQHIITTIQKQLTRALNNPNSFTIPRTGLHRRACRHLKKFIASGDLFFDKNVVVKDLKKIGLTRKEILYYYQVSLVTVRTQLLKARENADAISHPKIGKTFSTITHSGDYQDIRT